MIFATSLSRPCLLLTNALLPQVGRRTSGLIFRPVAAASASHQPDKAMDRDEKRGEVMSDSYGEGYASRADEEGFGRICGDDKSIGKDKSIHPHHPDYDKTQGSEVKEKERSRNQREATK